ncbi:hypothetical protein KKB55_06685 [Myxococcota bacterium]|nr:hypothetical protein [Myxococcota bacterium]MBU1897441.1 hypothetical protein [Myxococcota bacterium]
MASSLILRGRLALALALLLTSCGYRPLNQAPPLAPALRLGRVVDLSAEGDLGLLAARALRAELGAAIRAEATPRLEGEARLVDLGATAYTPSGPLERRLILILNARLLDEGRLLWLGEARQEVTLAAPALGAHQRRRLALRRAVDEAAHALCLDLRRAGL